MQTLNDRVLDLDYEAEATRIAHKLRESLRDPLNRRGLVVAMSGGIDSSVCAGLAVRALGPKKVFGLMLPETDGSSRSLELGKQLARHLGIEHAVEDIGPALEAIGCYRWRDEAIRTVFPTYGSGGKWKNKIVITGGLDGRYNAFNLVVEDPQGHTQTERLAARECFQIIAATNYKQRFRKAVEYFHADRLHYAVVGTPNRLEYDQGFFVKNGDGSADIKPIAHLYKTQVYQMARHLALPDAICKAIPTTDTYSLPQGQDEFYFALPYHQMDYALWAFDHHIGAADLATFLKVTAKQAQFVYQDIENKRRTTRYLHLPPVVMT